MAYASRHSARPTHDDYRGRSRRSMLFDRPASSAAGATAAGDGGRLLTQDEADDLRLMELEARAADSTARLRNALRTATATEDLGATALTELEAQGRQLDRISNGLDEVHANVHAGSRKITSMSNWFGMGAIKNWFGSKDPPQHVARQRVRTAEEEAALATRRQRGEGSAVAGRIKARQTRLRREGSGDGSDESDDTKIGSWGSTSRRSRGNSSLDPRTEAALDVVKREEAEQDKVLDDISVALRRLKAMSVAMGDEIAAQNVEIDDLEYSTHVADRSIVRATRRVNRLLN